MATIRERRPGVWEVRAFTGRDGRGRPTQVSRTVRGGKRDALRVAAELTVHPSPAIGGRSVADVLDAWTSAGMSTWAESTKRDNFGRAALVKNDPIATLKAARLSVADVERWHIRLRAAGVGEASIRNRHRVLRAALTQAVRWGWLATNPAALSRLRQSKRAPRGGMSTDEVRRVLAAAAALDLAAEVALRLAAVTGARRAELAALRWEDFHDDLVSIDSAIATIRLGRRGEAQTPDLVDSPTKTANARSLTLDSSTLELIERLRAERAAYGPWLLAIGDRPINPDRIGAWWRLARKRAGIDLSWRLHDLRHWSATTSVGLGHDIRTVANRLGHANPAMTLRIYAHAVEAADQAVARALGDALNEPMDGGS